MSAEQQSPEELRQEIAQTRDELGDTVEALAGKADVKGQAKAKVDSAKEGAQERFSAVKDTAQHKADQFASKARETTPESFSAGAEQLAGTAKANPVPVAIAAAFAGGLLVGWLLRR